MHDYFNDRLPSMDDLRQAAKRRMPKFAFEYLDGGCVDDVNLHKNVQELRQVELNPRYVEDFSSVDTRVELFGEEYAAPFGVAPVGLQGLMWPHAAEDLAAAATAHNLPFILSTVTTADIESVARITQGKAWFQLYHPTELHVLTDLLNRLKAAEYPVLVALADVPSFGYRPRDIRNGLAMPPRMTMRNIWEILTHPSWALSTLRYGQPEFKSLLPYMPQDLNIKQLAQFMNATFEGRLNAEKIQRLRDLWPGKLVVKGVVNNADLAACLRLGVDGVIVSNHGGRQIDAGQSTIHSLQGLDAALMAKTTVMMDSGVRTGTDVARALASGAAFTFMGRAFMYAEAALGAKGAHHLINMLMRQYRQVLEQLSCADSRQLPAHLIR